MCTEDGRITAASEVDHIKQHHGDHQLFYDRGNLQGLCHDHHRGYKARMERSGKPIGCDAQGNPTYLNDHWR